MLFSRVGRETCAEPVEVSVYQKGWAAVIPNGRKKDEVGYSAKVSVTFFDGSSRRPSKMPRSGTAAFFEGNPAPSPAQGAGSRGLGRGNSQ